MLQYTRYMAQRAPYELLAAAVLMLGLWAMHEANRMTPLVASLTFLLCFAVALVRNTAMSQDEVALMARERVDELQEAIQDYLRSHYAVDIWTFQSELMGMSDQRQPALPQLRPESLTYAALQAEELAEQLEAIVRVLYSTPELEAPPSEDNNHAHALHTITDHLNSLAADMQRASMAVRGALSYVDKDWVVRLDDKQAKPLLDGVTDVAVVTAGFGLASGLPVREAYVDVGSSNHSKANPATGKIDKDPSGKWIKGVAYREPNLLAVLAAQRAEVQEGA